jgi:hypothetical protein
MENRCKDVVDALGDREGLASADAQVLAQHLESCANCRAIDRGLRAIPDLVRVGIDGALDADASREVAREAFDTMVAVTDRRVREKLKRTLTLADEEALSPAVDLLKKA